MANPVSTIQSLKAVDAWIDVINANINGGVRTAFKASRLRFAGSNTQIDRAPTSTTLPLQLPEPSLITANTVIDWSQGAITSSTEVTHLAIQGEGFFVLIRPDMMATNGQIKPANLVTDPVALITRDGEFHTDASGLLVHSGTGYYLATWSDVGGTFNYRTAVAYMHGVYNDLELPPAPGLPRAANLSEYLTNVRSNTHTYADGNTIVGHTFNFLLVVDSKQALPYSRFGSTVFDLSLVYDAASDTASVNPLLNIGWQTSATILTKSLEASNASMTQSVPELSLAQKLFSALTKVLQIHQTNQDAVLNTIR